MYVRRSAAVLAASVALCASAAPAALADPSPAASAAPSAPANQPPAAPAAPTGLYGTGDPTYDGVFRQSLSLLAQHSVGVRPAPAAVSWLTGQQCANGSFAAFRADPTKACDATTMADTNATAAAVQALAALGGHQDAVTKAVDWLKSVQNEDGGWSYGPGTAMDSGTDANSTGIVIGALAAAGEEPDKVRSKKNVAGGTALQWLQIRCQQEGETGPTPSGAFAFQADKSGKLLPNADATAAAVLGVLGTGMAVQTPTGDAAKKDFTAVNPLSCKMGPGDGQLSADNGAKYLADTMAATGHHLMSAMPGATDQPDFGNTADAVVALAAAGYPAAAAQPLSWLQQNAAGWAKTAGPAAYAQLILAARATGADPRAFGGTDLVAALNAQGPAPQTDKPQPEQQKNEEKKKEQKKEDSGSSIGWMIGAGAAAGVGIGFLLSGRRKKQQP
ncbi:prenyltransferase/squalene oxidase repeat-containing protein [Streptomyces sp. WAC06614]|uniref:prenyltransferase/squalene oxidase repeat-containing protein n=1 Tax=Streptomyces sp. WAC06614 TaxID=2487416 RepID=UPI000F78A7C9|nr:prenyltransferase/squalene oxidase repeat-containing protein [Streptomyces sp. WAC06614]RSS56399.1 hypothetical protein EF918_34150 [Streptomyces sp. WAC06614]